MYDARTRDRFRTVVGALTGIAAVASATAAGIVTGMAAHATEDAQQAQAGNVPPAPSRRHRTQVARPRAADAQRTVIRWKDRPRHTEVLTRTVYRTVPSTSSTLGGGTVTGTSAPSYTGAPSGTTGTTGTGGTGSSGSSSGGTSPGGGASGPPPSSGGTGGGGGGPQNPPPAPPPPPAQPPAPSTGS